MGWVSEMLELNQELYMFPHLCLGEWKEGKEEPEEEENV